MWETKFHSNTKQQVKLQYRTIHYELIAFIQYTNYYGRMTRQSWREWNFFLCWTVIIAASSLQIALKVNFYIFFMK
jgi:hypothetical protein